MFSLRAVFFTTQSCGFHTTILTAAASQAAPTKYTYLLSCRLSPVFVRLLGKRPNSDIRTQRWNLSGKYSDHCLSGMRRRQILKDMQKLALLHWTLVFVASHRDLFRWRSESNITREREVMGLVTKQVRVLANKLLWSNIWSKLVTYKGSQNFLTELILSIKRLHDNNS